MTAQSWQPAAHQQPPATGEIHVWRIDLNCAATPASASLLSPDERERAARLLVEDKRAQFVAGRGVLRRVLGQYLGVAPQALVFAYGPHGKPTLRNDGSAAELAFNFSHSANLALIGVARAGTIGIDIEHRGRHISVAPFARHILSASEAATLARRPQARHRQVLLATWTRKEAYLKALGVGLSRPMTGFTTGIAEDGATVVRELEDAGGKPQPWAFIPLAAHPDYLACLAVPGRDWTVQRFDWQPVD
jgi:4'-phosphopantetheinyl transferase